MINHLSKLALLFILLGILVPFSPKMPTISIDYSWAIALNQAVAQGLVFGKDIIFTLGPFASLYTKVYHPATDAMMIASSFYFAIFYWLLCRTLIKRRALVMVSIFALILLGLVYARDVLFFSYPLLLGLWIVNHLREIASTKSYQIVFALFLTPLGLLMLIKGTFLIQVIWFLLSTNIYLIYLNQKQLAALSFLSVTLACTLFWLCAHQPIFALPTFILHSINISMGFSESMSNNGNSTEIWIFLGVALFQLLTVVCHKQYNKSEKAIVLCYLASFLFIAFKAGFTRHQGHVFVASTALLFSGVIFMFVYQTRLSVAIFIVSLLCSLFITIHHTQLSLQKNIRTTVKSAYHGLHSRLTDPNWLKDNYQTLMTFIAGQSKFPQFDRSADIYSYDQVFLLASGNQWAPRPIFQSYSTFTAKLANRNKDKLIHNPPEHILFRLQPLDNKLPALDDGASWRILLSNYQLIGSVNQYLILDHRPIETLNNPTKNMIVDERHQIGDTVFLNNLTSLSFIRITINPTIWGRVWSVLFKPNHLHIKLTLQDGSTRLFRFSANMAHSEFLLSPLVETTQEFAQLFQNPGSLDNKIVQSFEIMTVPKNSKHWSKQYHLTYQ